MGDTSEQVVALLNTAQVSTTAEGKVQALKRVEELTVNLQPQLLDNFFDARFSHTTSFFSSRLSISSTLL